MKQQTEKRLLLADALPAFAVGLRQLLIAKDEPELAARVPGLQILDRCRCKDDFCATFYTQPKPDGAYRILEFSQSQMLPHKCLEQHSCSTKERDPHNLCK